MLCSPMPVISQASHDTKPTVSVQPRLKLKKLIVKLSIFKKIYMCIYIYIYVALCATSSVLGVSSVSE